MVTASQTRFMLQNNYFTRLPCIVYFVPSGTIMYSMPSIISLRGCFFIIDKNVYYFAKVLIIFHLLFY